MMSPSDEVLRHLTECAGSWEPDARLLGNVTARELYAFCVELSERRSEGDAAERKIADLTEQLGESRDLCRIQEGLVETADRAREHALLVGNAERLLRQAVERDARQLELRLSARMGGRTVTGRSGERSEGRVVRLRKRMVWGIREFLFDCFPELDVRTEHSLPHLIVSELRGFSARVDRLLQRPPERRRGTVVLLPPPEYKGPRFSSQTFVSSGASGETLVAEFEGIHWILPPGGWVVAHGCTLSDVYVGHVSQNRGPDGDYCQLSDEVPLGGRLRVRVKFD